uniref:F-box family protein n=1 Tax=Pithovirus LCPAC401 TaxID=2506595 RepID=A0A481ZAV7_9VIRU|nr:MAG: F-box family protein [Pithovirus LCPAC401]
MDSTSSDSLQIIFTYLDVEEISRKCLTNHLFDRVCRSESLWKNVLSRDYSIIEKKNETWRKKAKEVYIESTLFWNSIDNSIDYQMENYLGEDLVDKFEKKLSDHALRERKEFFVIKLIFKVFFINEVILIDYIENGYTCRNFISLFKKVASLSPQKKISTKWILDLVHEDDCKRGCECEDKCEYKYKGLFKLFPGEINILNAIYLKYDHLFMNDISSINWKDYCCMLSS